jgi:FkbM family methyltransferase
MAQNLFEHIVQRNLGRLGFEIRRSGVYRNLMNFIEDRDIDVVLDVGANVGQFAKELRSKGYQGKIISFEPVRAVYETLSEMAANDDNWETRNFALGATAGSATINVADSSVFSSMLPSTAAAGQFAESSAVTRTETIEIKTLDDVVVGEPGNLLLKIDTQGFEKQVLEGGRSTLTMAKGVLMELPIIHLYERTWQLHEAIEFMGKANFVPTQMHPVNYHWLDKEALVEVDCLFRPRDNRID